MSKNNGNGELIYSYSRQQAIEDGILADVSETAKEAGFCHPVAITIPVWQHVLVPTERECAFGQSEMGRLWDVLTLLRHAIRMKKADGDTILFDVLIARGDRAKPERVRLKAICGPDDDLSPCLTIMLPDED